MTFSDAYYYYSRSDVGTLYNNIIGSDDTS